MPAEDVGAPAGGWTPRRTLCVGITGHRPERLDDVDVAALKQAAGAVLDSIVAAARMPAADLRLVTALAEGADSIVAEAALAHGWQLDVVLPFAREDYIDDFAQGAPRDEHRALLDRARAVFELPGDRAGQDGAVIAYERAGRVMLSQADILLAIWDSGPSRGRGGAAQIVAEAVLRTIPVIHIDPAGRHSPRLLWDGLVEADLGQQTVATVARGELDRLDGVIATLLDVPATPHDLAMLALFARGVDRRRAGGAAYPLLLATMGVRWPRLADLGFGPPAADPADAIASCASGDAFAARLSSVLRPRFARADAIATDCARLFRSSYVTNFILAATAVLLSMLGLVLPAALKPGLIALEVAAIATILLTTHRGRRAGWHRRWLDNRALAERLRCLALLAQLGDLDLHVASTRTASWVDHAARGSARALGLPHVRADATYLRCVRDALAALIDDQIAYLSADAHRMHRLDHRLHVIGTCLFALTALACLTLLGFKAAGGVLGELVAWQQPVGITVTILSAVLPAIGAAIYGIRMQGDFAGVAGRSDEVRRQLVSLREAMADDPIDFDTLDLRLHRAAALLTGSLASWLQAYHARPLTLPG